MKYYLQAFSNYATIKGRMPRNDFWQFMLFNIVFLLLSQMADQLFGSILSFRFIRFLYQFVLLAPTVSAMVRRLHDTGKSGKWLLLLFGIACISPVIFFLRFVNYGITFGYSSHVITALSILIILTIVVLIYLLSLAGDKGINKYGPDPREVKTDEGEG